MKIGFAKDAFPKVIPHVIAYKQNGADMEVDDDTLWQLKADDFKDHLAYRNKISKKKQPPNIYTSLQTYNKSVEPQQVSVHNDSYTFDWTETTGRPFICGKEALKIDPAENYKPIWPIKRGTIDRVSYKSYREAIVDLERIWTWAVRSALNVTQPFDEYSVMMVVPANVSRWEIRAYTECILSYMGFKAISFIVEPVACSFGAGITSSCIVDMGAQTVTVACVEEGLVLPESLNVLPYGGNDITLLLSQILAHHSFPYTPSPGLSDPLDWELFNDLRERFCTLDEEEIQSLVYEFYVRRPGNTTLNYNFKVIEERIIPVAAMLEDGAPWLSSFEKVRRDATDNKALQFWTGQYDLDGGLITNAGTSKDNGDGKVDQASNETEDGLDIATVEEEQSIEIASQQEGGTSANLTANLFECKWAMCDAPSFETLPEIIEHIKSAHLGDETCQWSDCSFSSRSEIARLCHLMDHLNERMEITPDLDSPFVHAEPALQPLSEKSLIQAILDSCASSGNRCLSSILVVGGLANTPSLTPALWSSLSQRIESNETQVDFVATGKDLDLAFFSWKGGAVASKLDPTAETWIYADEWRAWGPKLFRERLPFAF